MATKSLINMILWEIYKEEAKKNIAKDKEKKKDEKKKSN